jgi:hypothetical protein
MSVKTSANTRPKNRRTLLILGIVIATILTISVTYIIIYPNL